MRSACQICLAGDPAARDSMVFDRVVELASTGLPITTLMSDAARLLEEASAC